MKTKQIETWLPCFSGFYGTIWQADGDEAYELQHINDERANKGFAPIKWDDIKWDYDEYHLQVVKGIARRLEVDYLKPFVKDIKVERVVSPREYNFANDSANIIVTLCVANEKRILKYLSVHKDRWAQWLKDRYTSRSGFISSYPNYIDGFMQDEPLTHKHKLGSILDFIARNEANESSNEDIEMDLYSNIEKYLSAINYDELVNGKEGTNE